MLDANEIMQCNLMHMTKSQTNIDLNIGLQSKPIASEDLILF